MAEGDANIRLDQGGINARILAKEAKVDFRRVESASRKIQTTFSSPEIKRLFVRYFNSAQLNSYLISVIARAKLPHAAIEKVEGTLKTQLEKLHRRRLVEKGSGFKAGLCADPVRAQRPARTW